MTTHDGSFETFKVAVSRALGEVIGSDVDPASPLLDYPGFDSLAIVQVVERIEDDLGTEVPPEVLVPETFESVETLVRVIWEHCGPATGVSGRA